MTKLLTEDDWQLRRKLSLSAIADAPWAYGHTYKQVADRPPQFWRDQIADRTSTIVAFMDGRPVGDVCAIPSPNRPDAQEITSAWVAPEARSSGVGDKLLRTQLQWLQDNGHRQAQLWTRQDNAPVRRLG
ncbi:GNAT family N-acetyltransferase [Nocardia brasiliensis]|uniref:GNAT family N-acetyltransferase n=1 Tax=Nocardia brasiliensis TaxID=37326 RepID=UPI0024561DC6|nr:GNAT family N-acetyltransferase [Nocardia brasiliensis]